MKRIKIFLLLLVAAVTLPAGAQQMPPLPVDSAVRIGKLANGLTYYLRANKLPENRVNFYIAQKVGSVQEEDSQRGLAHFLEHMCFNGTDNFPDDRLIKYCERIGVKFGENLNAYTSTDETVYNIDAVPVSESNIDSCLLILRDWSCGLTLATPEIDKERGVIHEEWRMRSSAGQRIFERNLPALYPGSRYGHRFPIGTMEVIDNFKPEELRAYYHKWYRPDLQGLVIVGDINVDQIEQKIKNLFSDIKMPENPAAYELYPVPATPEAIYIVDKDKELQNASISVMFKHEPLSREARGTVAYLAEDLIYSVMSSALNARLSELSQKEGCPFLGAYIHDDNYLISKTMKAYTVGLAPKPGKSIEAVKAVMAEVKRAAEHGFTDTEIIRVREELKSQMEKLYNNRDKQESSFYIPQYVRHFLEGDAIPDIATEYNMATMLLGQLPAQVYSMAFKESVASTDSNFVFLAMYPESDVIPTADQFKQAMAEVKGMQVEAYVDNVKNEPLVPALPKAGKIKSEKPAAFGYTCWTLENGARVFYKQTDFDNSQVLFSANSFGGLNKLDEKKDLANMKLFNSVISLTGLGNFTATELEKKLAGKQVGVSASLGDDTENLSGTATPKDLRTLFELIYLRFQAPANDPDGFRSCINVAKTQLENADKVPNLAFSDSITSTLFPGVDRKVRIHVEDLAKADYEAIRRIYSERFAAGGDFDFYFTGAFDVDSLRAFTEQYIAPLKAQKKREKSSGRAILPVKGDRHNLFRREMETPQATTVQVWWGEHKHTLKQAAVVNALGSILSQRYLKSIREEGSMAYSVGAQGTLVSAMKDIYQLQVYCPVKPEKLDSALILMEQGIMDIARDGVTADELAKVKEFELKEFADVQKKNSYWQTLIHTNVLWGKDLRTGNEEAIKSVTSDDVKAFVNDVLLKQRNRSIISMLPADMKE